MTFNSIIFIFAFLPLCVAGYYILPGKVKNTFLVLMSFLFLIWGDPDLWKVMLCVIASNYIAGLAITYGKQKGYLVGIKVVLFLSVLGNLFCLFHYKYYNFAASEWNRLAGGNLELLDLALPLGLSFFLFQSISYVIDVYRGDAKAVKNPLDLALYITFFPKLAQGPIVQYKDFAPQLVVRHISVADFTYGLQRFIIGLAKKLMIANILGDTVTRIWESMASNGMDAPTAWLGALCYMLQLFVDFSGYSDMAIGLAALFGFRFKENFDFPYIAKSITEFWRRWHISLSTWFREYLYIPLGGNRTGNVYVNLFIVFLVTGLWHGASWNFILWGMFHGVFIVLERAIRGKEWYQKLPGFVKWIVTMFLVLIGWVFFRAANLENAGEFLSVMFGIKRFSDIEFAFAYYIDRRFIVVLVIALLLSVPWNRWGWKILPEKIRSFAVKHAMLVQGCKYVLLLGLMILNVIVLINSDYSPFLYFQF